MCNVWQKYKYLISGFVIFIMLALFYQNLSQPQEVKLYFSDEQAQSLVVRQTEIQDDNLYQSLIEQLIKGPKGDELLPTIPVGTELLGIEVQDGLVKANFSQELRTKHWGGSAGEIMTVYSIVNTLSDLEEIDRVQILIEGEKIQTLAGHLDLSQPLKFNKNII